MDLNAFAAKSEPIVLADVSPEFMAFEGIDVEREKRVSVVVRTATSEDKINRAALISKQETKYEGDGKGGISISKVVDANAEYRKMMECYWTIESFANLVRGGEPVFKKMPIRDMNREEFIRSWGPLPPELTQAVHVAVLKHNPLWNDELLGE
jgi:hypothetical protein